jgi:hypothetical protein
VRYGKAKAQEDLPAFPIPLCTQISCPKLPFMQPKGIISRKKVLVDDG